MPGLFLLCFLILWDRKGNRETVRLLLKQLWQLRGLTQNVFIFQQKGLLAFRALTTIVWDIFLRVTERYNIQYLQADYLKTRKSAYQESKIFKACSSLCKLYSSFRLQWTNAAHKHLELLLSPRCFSDTKLRAALQFRSISSRSGQTQTGYKVVWAACKISVSHLYTVLSSPALSDFLGICCLLCVKPMPGWKKHTSFSHGAFNLYIAASWCGSFWVDYRQMDKDALPVQMQYCSQSFCNGGKRGLHMDLILLSTFPLIHEQQCSKACATPFTSKSIQILELIYPTTCLK